IVTSCHFFFQAEDGIRDFHVTGVQTCALPIYIAMVPAGFRWNDLGSWQSLLDIGPADADGNVILGDVVAPDCENSYIRSEGSLQIGRASCRERVSMLVVVVSVNRIALHERG